MSLCPSSHSRPVAPRPSSRGPEGEALSRVRVSLGLYRGPAAASRAATLGLDAVAVAASYHATRAATPLHPGHRIFEAEHAACYVPVREQAWRGHRLVPDLPAWDPDGHSFGNACRQLTAEGLQVEAWIVLTHNSALGCGHPDLVVRNAFGDVYPYALCPAAQNVQEYCLTLVEEIVRSGPLHGVVLEACGPMGIEHAGKHDKTEFATWDEARRALLSLCFCQACERRYAAAGLDSDRLAELVRAGVDSRTGTIGDCLGGWAAEVAAIRTGIAGELRASLAASCRSVAPGVRITVHGSSDVWATGSFATVQPAVGEDVDAVVASCWDPEAGGHRISDLRALVAPGTDVGAYLRLDRGWSAGDATDQRLREYLASGMGELHLYHLGLLDAQGLATMRHVVATTRRLAAQQGSA
jgi:hypothetical protein